MGSFGFQYSDVVLNIEHTVADGISNGNAHGPSRTEFTSDYSFKSFYYFIGIFTIRILFAIFLEVSTNVSFQNCKKYEKDEAPLLKKKEKKDEDENVY